MKKLREKIFESIGKATMCWSEFPRGIFRDDMAVKIGEELLEEIDRVNKNLIEVIEFYADVSNWDNVRLPDNGARAREVLETIKKEIKNEHQRT